VTETKGGGGADPRVVLVHDYLLVLRGAERTFLAMADCWPRAPVATLLYDPAIAGPLAGHEVRTSALQRFNADQQSFRRMLPLYPVAARRLPVKDGDLVISSSSAFAHGVQPRPDAMHVCYCHSPLRYVWHERERGREESPAVLRPAMRMLQRRLRAWDRQSAARVTHYIANSRLTQQLIHDFWGQESTIVHPPVSVERFLPESPEDYFLVVGEVVGHKRPALALEAARRAGQNIKVAGSGPGLAALRAQYGSHAEFLGRVSDADLNSLLARARALIVPNVEEFGIVAVEAQAAGRPVVAARGGGSLETVIDGETGILFPPGDADALAEILRHTNFDRFRAPLLTAHARSFSTERFQRRLREVIQGFMGDDRAADRPEGS